jgi:hypothetical protein
LLGIGTVLDGGDSVGTSNGVLNLLQVRKAVVI